MNYMSAEVLQSLGARIFDAVGSPHNESEYVSGVLVGSNLMGHDSHGVIRIPQYVDSIREGKLKPGAPLEVGRETRGMAVVDGHQGWGPVVARNAMRLAMSKARECSVGTVVVRGSQHVGRVGEYPAMAAAEGMIGLAFVNSHGGGTSVVPWGGIDGRFAPNPMAFAAPSGEAWPVLIDLTTSVVPEGKVRLAHFQGVPLPENCIIDAEGQPTTDPAAFYGPPPGALLPLGGPVGHKGTGLALMTELLAGVLSGAGYSGQAVPTQGNGLCFQAIHVADFLPIEEFIRTVKELVAWVKSSRLATGVAEILIPGEPEYRTSQRRLREGIPIDDGVWSRLLKTAAELGLDASSLNPAS